MCNFLSNTIKKRKKLYQSNCRVLVHGCQHHRKNPKSPSYAQWQNSQLVSGEAGKKEEKGRNCSMNEFRSKTHDVC